MSFTEEKREWIKKYMLEKIRQDDGRICPENDGKTFEVSITTVKKISERVCGTKNHRSECG